MSTRSDIIQEALLNADKIHESTVNRAKEELYNVFSEKIEKSVRRALDETVGVGKDQPSGYDQEEDQDALAYGSSKHSTAKKDDINKGGKGPQKLEGSINVDEEFSEEDEFDGDQSGDPSLDVIPTSDEELDEMFGEEDDEELDEASEDDEELDEASEDDEELDETKEEDDLDETKEEDDLDENKFKQVKAENKELQKENKDYKRAFGILKNKFTEVNLLNAKLGGAMKFLRNPSLTLKQKESIVETFDRAKNVGEVKLIVRTLNESYKHSSLRKPIVERPTKSVSSKRINESYNNNSQRLQELAGI